MRNILLGVPSGSPEIAKFLLERSLARGTPGVVKSDAGNFPLAWYDQTREGWWISSYGWDRKPPTQIAPLYRKLRPTQATKAASLRRAIRNLLRGKQISRTGVEVPSRNFHTPSWCGRFVRAVLAYNGVATITWQCGACGKRHFDIAPTRRREIQWRKLVRLLKASHDDISRLELLERTFSVENWKKEVK